MRTLLAGLALALAVGVPRAHADCMSPRPFVSPADGTVLPPDPTVFLFVPEGFLNRPDVEMTIDVSNGGQSVAYSTERVSQGPAFTTYRIEIGAGAVRPQVDAPAYRVEWAASEEAYAAGQRSSIVVPHDMRSFFRGPWNATASAEPAEVQLGHADCMDHTMAWPDAQAWIGLWALQADGSDLALTDTPLRLARPRED